jgi:biopolymer transport protein ExbD
MGGGVVAAGADGRDARGRGMIVGINVTPLVDIVLVLLVIMMVASTYIVAQTLKVELPRTRTSDGTAQSPSVLTILRGGDVRWNGEGVSEAEVAARIRDAMAENPELALVVSADREVPHGRVVHFVDIARLSGVRRFAINVESGH